MFFDNASLKLADSVTFIQDKKEIADQYGEITNLWRCSTMNRKNALTQGIYSWRDPRSYPISPNR